MTKIEPDKLDLRGQERLIVAMEELPVVNELHQTGLTLEALLTVTSPDAPISFGFNTTPPWALEKSVEQAVKWFQDNRSSFPPAADAVTPDPAPKAVALETASDKEPTAAP